MNHSSELGDPQRITRRELILSLAGIMGCIFARNLLASETNYDATTSASIKDTTNNTPDSQDSNVLLVLMSFHHKNTEKIAHEIAKVLGAQIKTPNQISVQDIQKHKLVGFGSGIYDQQHHRTVLELVDKLPNNLASNVFIYSTSGVSRKFCLKNSIEDPHDVIRNKLRSKGCKIIDEYNCAGWNTNSFLKIFGGINWGKPNSNDLGQARKFAENLRADTL